MITQFYATWCGPCKAYTPVLEKFAAKHGLELVRIDVEEEPDKAALFNVQTVPTTVFDNGKPFGSHKIVGPRTSKQLEAELTEYI